MSITLQIFSDMVLESDPPDTVKSCAYTYTSLPFIVPQPVTTPSPSGWDAYRPPAHGAAAGDDSVAVKVLPVHAEVRAAVLDEHVEFLETALVEKQGEPLPGGKFTFFVLGVDSFLASA